MSCWKCLEFKKEAESKISSTWNSERNRYEFIAKVTNDTYDDYQKAVDSNYKELKKRGECSGCKE